MQTVQVAISNPQYSSLLQRSLRDSGLWNVVQIERPDPKLGGVVVLDEAVLESLPVTPVEAERIVLITRKEVGHLSKAWEVGVRTVIFDSDPIDTALLAIMGASLRASKSEAVPSGKGSGPSVSSSLAPLSQPQSHPGGRRRPRMMDHC